MLFRSVTGGSKGIGRAIAEGFAAEGANVSICARNAGDMTATVAALKAKGVKAFGQALDVADGPALAAWIAATAKDLGGLDTLVCNVSALAVGDTAESWERSFAVDMMHTVNAVKAAVPHLEKSTGGSIVLISSVSGFEVDFACPNNRYINDEAICQAITAMWARVGVKAKLRTLPLVTYFPMIQQIGRAHV